MNKTAIKNFAIWARNTLIKDTMYKARLVGVSADGMQEPLPNSTKDMQFFDVGTDTPYSISGPAVQQRRSFVTVLRQKAAQSDYVTAYQSLMEEVAYTWFNRLIAIRFMEVNGYLPSGIRVLSSESGKWEPDIVTTPFDAELPFMEEEELEIARLKRENQNDTVFQLLFIKQCNALHDILPQLFETTADYTELLLNLSITDQDGVVYRLVHDIDEADFDVSQGGQVEIIGWLYQYYNTELKDETFKLLNKNIKVTKERLPSATQLFTPDWIVRYMVENSLGRMWIQGHMESPDQEEAMAKDFGWQYYLPEAAQEPDVKAKLQDIRKEYGKLRPEDLTVIDPCMGSGHILVYAFDVLMQIYRVNGYSDRDAAELILERNLYGLDIDDRAFQLAYFSVLMKARQYSRRILSRKDENGRLNVPQPHVYAIMESKEIGGSYKSAMGDFLLSEEHQETLNYLLDAFSNAKEYGSILQLEERDYAGLMEAWKYTSSQTVEDFNMTLWYSAVEHEIPKFIEQAILLTKKYDIVVTNPPYMGVSNMNGCLSNYIKKEYPNSKSDLFAVFIERCGRFNKAKGYQAMITQQSWMFLSSFEILRQKILTKTIINMAHLGARAFDEIGGEVVQTTAFVVYQSRIADYKGLYCRLIAPTTQQGKENMFLNKENRYIAQQVNFSNIPGVPIAYWVTKNVIRIYKENKLLEKIADVRHGLSTGKNELFVRRWTEVVWNKIDFQIKNRNEIMSSNAKFFPYNKGGEYRKWFGNAEYIIWYDTNGQKKMATLSGHRHDGKERYFQEGITWSFISSSKFGCRYTPSGFVFDVAGSSLFVKYEFIWYLTALLCSKLGHYFMTIQNPTMNFQVGNLKNIPVIVGNNKKNIDEIALTCIHNSKDDWDSLETSWDFVRHPLVDLAVSQATKATLAQRYEAYKAACEARFKTLKDNEEELNRIFIAIYGLQDELTPDVAEKDVTVARVYDTKEDIPPSMKGNNYVLTKQDVVKSLLSYAVGCMFGRYSLDVDGLAYAGGDWDDSKYVTFIPDKDNVIPITDTEYFKDDIVGLFYAWLKKVYGVDTLEENLAFIAQALGGKGTTSRDVLRSYFLKDFYKDHCKTYKKRPIYWLFDSGKQNGFKALVYLHRYDADTIGKVRVEYLYKMERIYENEIARMQDIMDHTDSAREKTRATKTREKLQKQLKECRDYDEKLAHLAADRITIDLDDGVKVNYEKIQTARDGKKYQILAKI